MKNKSMSGFWATIVIAVAAGGTMLSVVYLNPTNSVKGFLSIMVVAALFLLMANLIINFLHKDDKAPEKEDGKKDVYSSTEALTRMDILESEFHCLVYEIASRNAEASGKLLTLKEADTGRHPKEKLISPEDIEVAFLEAISLVSKNCSKSESSCGTDCCKQTLLDRIKALRKRYEKNP